MPPPTPKPPPAPPAPVRLPEPPPPAPAPPLEPEPGPGLPAAHVVLDLPTGSDALQAPPPQDYSLPGDATDDLSDLGLLPEDTGGELPV